ncbi:hypothetical protein MKX03_027128 [Papaver bracteatum]|nr:hypothetical protein MKX03_027128 [Papaver bracteatum]
MNTIDRFDDFTSTIYKTDSRFRELRNPLKILISYFLERMSLRGTSMGEQSESNGPGDQAIVFSHDSSTRCDGISSGHTPWVRSHHQFPLLQIPQLKAGTSLQSTNLPSSTLSSCTPVASSDSPASVDTMSSGDTSVDEQTERTNKYNFMKEAYLPLMDAMVRRLGCRIQQLPISSENFPSHLKPDEIVYLQKYKTKLETARSLLQISRGPRQSMDAVIRWEKQTVRHLNLPNAMAAVQLPDDLLSQLQIPQLKQHDSNQNNPEKSVSTMTPIERLVKAVERSSPKALSAAVDDIPSVVSMTDVFAGSHSGEGGARSFFHENLASTTRGHVECRNFRVVKDVDEKKLKQCYSVESSSRLEVNHVLLEEVGEINHLLINTKLSISDKSISLASGAGEDVEGMIVNCTFSPISRSSYTEKFPALRMWFLIPANDPLCTHVLLDCSHDSQSHSYEYEYLLTDGMAESWDSCADAAFSEHASRMEKY